MVTISASHLLEEKSSVVLRRGVIKLCSTEQSANVSKNQRGFLFAFIFLTVSKAIGRSRVFPLLH